MEAMACGLPILSTNCKSGPNEIMELEILNENLMITEYGILVPVKNEKVMALGIDYFLTQKHYANTCKVNVQKRIHDFNKDNILKKYIDLITTKP